MLAEAAPMPMGTIDDSNSYCFSLTSGDLLASLHLLICHRNTSIPLRKKLSSGNVSAVPMNVGVHFKGLGFLMKTGFVKLKTIVVENSPCQRATTGMPQYGHL